MSYDLEHKTIYSATEAEVVVDDIGVIGARHTMVTKEADGQFSVTVSTKRCDIDPARMDIVTVTPAMLEAMMKAVPHCKEGDRCVCGGDTAAVRAGCHNWLK